jgi:hypothetical protein
VDERLEKGSGKVKMSWMRADEMALCSGENEVK